MIATEVSGLVSETVIELSKDYKAESKKKLEPVRIVVVRQVQQPDELWQWRAKIIAGKNDKRSGRIDLFGADGRPMVSFEIKKAWPYKWIWPNLDAADTAPALEEIYFIADMVVPTGT